MTIDGDESEDDIPSADAMFPGRNGSWFALSSKKKTLKAGPSHAHLPLHVQAPPVNHLNWRIARGYVETYGTTAELIVFDNMSRYFLDEDAAAELWAARAEANPTAPEADIFDGDIEGLLAANFCEPLPAGMRPVGTIAVFTVLEMIKQRRRTITWPKHTAAEERRIWQLLKNSHATVKYLSTEEILAATREFCCHLDYKKFFQQFVMAPGVRKYYCFLHKGKWYQLVTIPTGGVFPPIIAQILSNAIAAGAVAHNARDIDMPGYKDVTKSVMIDNTRFTSNHAASLNRVWDWCTMACSDIGITIGEIFPPSNKPYDFLGIHFDHPHVSVAAKTCSKLENIHSTLTEARSGSPTEIRDVLAAFGVCFWASIITGHPLTEVFYVIKFVRRMAAAHNTANPTAKCTIWPCILETWDQWSTALRRRTRTISGHSGNDHSALVFTDASLKGWGSVIFATLAGIRSTWIVGARWTSKMSKMAINQLETKAIANSLKFIEQQIERQGFHTIDVDLLVDNTTALSATTKLRSRSYLVNMFTKEIQATIARGHTRIASATYVASANNLADAPSRQLPVNNLDD